MNDCSRGERIQCMFDTNAFNRLLESGTPVDALSGYVAAYATHVQQDELNNTKNDGRRTALAILFGDLSSEWVIPTETTVLGVSRLGGSKLTSEENLYVLLKSDLDKRNGNKRSNVQDALIAETSIKYGLVLVTDDQDLTIVTSEHGGKCACFEQLLREITG